MNLVDFIGAIKTRFSKDKPLRRTRSDKGDNTTPKGISDRGEYNEAEERDIRAMMVREANYAEVGPTYDPSGKYLCQDCRFRLPTDLDHYNAQCNRVEGLISLISGSCNIFEFGDWSADDMLLTLTDQNLVHGEGKLTKEAAGYQERPTSKAFGCLRCTHGARAKYTDKEGRRVWCRHFGTHVASTACCGAHEGSDSVKEFAS